MKKLVFASTIALSAFMFSCNSEAPSTEAETISTETTVVEPVTTETMEVPTAVVSDPTTLSVDRMEHDFGKISDAAPVETKFVVTNTGDKPLLISDAQGSCGCTVPVFPKEPIAPGESRDIEVSFNPSGKSGAQNKTVTITANTEPAQTIINLKSDIQTSAQ